MLSSSLGTKGKLTTKNNVNEFCQPLSNSALHKIAKVAVEPLAQYNPANAQKKLHAIGRCQLPLKSTYLIKSLSSHSVLFGGVATCNRFTCPECAPKRIRASSLFISQALANAEKKNYTSLMLTITQPCGDLSLLDQVGKHVKDRTKLSRILKNKSFECLGVIGDIKSLGVSYTQAYDRWSVHSHIIIISKNELTEQHKNLIIKKWHKLTGASLEHGCKFSACEKSAHYMANQIPKVTNQILHAIAEATHKASKELLEQRYCNLVEALKGRACVMFSRGLKAQLNVKPNRKPSVKYLALDREVYKQIMRYELSDKVKKLAYQQWGAELMASIHKLISECKFSRYYNKPSLSFSSRTILRQ